MGQALFSASMGGTPVQRVLEALKKEAEQIFKGRATTNVSLRPTVNLYKELLKKSRDAMIAQYDNSVRAKAAALGIQGETTEALDSATLINESVFSRTIDKKELEKAGDAAADFRQQAEACTAALTQDAARFLRLQLAISLLQSQIEQFRKENQGPLLQKAGEVFNAITCNAFSGLGADFKADDVPILVGLRLDQTKVPVEGLSDGSRDQLYLALRLAALDRFLETHESMPLILDDLLITFDKSEIQAPSSLP